MSDDVRHQLIKALAAQHSCDTLLTIPFCNRCKQSADTLLPLVERLLNHSNSSAFRAGWNHATAGWEQRAANQRGPGRAHIDGCDCPTCATPPTTTNLQRAAEVLGFRELEDAKRYARDDLNRIAAALDAAETRGRAEVAAKVEEIAHEWGRHASPWGRAADRLRALVAEVPR